jgi:chromodomain-helicase-DNA-binding protein 1
MHILLLSCQVKKYGDTSRINVIAAEVGGSIESATTRAQMELFEALINGCKEVVRAVNGEGKVCAVL